MLDNILESKQKIQKAHWEPPTENQVKVNFDTSFHQPNNRAVSGIINHMSAFTELPSQKTCTVFGSMELLFHSVPTPCVASTHMFGSPFK
ncbi:hypothetical protein Goklo_026510 [Gossypium klotzschianum]|uniref:Uncharacterized protein n=1 Tax=Gossypium klotzschianum TaxID=34286 RepID=A0A7J8TUZ7_9ROSI|nr:hypothetical protein [Gossypium klotzschianum]